MIADPSCDKNTDSNTVQRSIPMTKHTHMCTVRATYTYTHK